MSEKQLLGSETAKNGFRNEEDVVDKFNSWQTDTDAQEWLVLMQYTIAEIESVNAVKLSGHKTDVQAQITIKLKEAIDAQNLQVKLVSNTKGFNQIDKRWIEKYRAMWEMPDTITSILKRYTGKEKPRIEKPRDARRMFADEFSVKEQVAILGWLNNTKSLIVSDVLKGRGQFAAEWMLVAQRNKSMDRWVLKPMNYCLNFFGNGR